jgi:hypothetical protein
MAQAGGLAIAPFIPAPRGLATAYPEQDTPQQFALDYLNLFTTAVGDAEKRPGIEQLVDPISTRITITNFHELIDETGATLLFASGDGQIWLVDESGAGDHERVFTFATTSAKVFSFYSSKRLIFYNGVDRCVYTTDGETFNELLSILESGTAVSAAGVSAPNAANRLQDDAIASWLGTDVTRMDLVYYSEVSAYGLVQQATTAYVSHTAVSASAGGIGYGTTPVSGARYAIIDTVEVNIVPVSGLGFATDNQAVLSTGSDTTNAIISAVDDFTTTILRTGDFIFNETRQQVAQIATISAKGLVYSRAITGQAAGDTVYLLRSSAPIIKYGVTHFQRAYAIDARDDQKMRISAVGDPEDWGSINAGTYDISSQQPASERFRQLLSFQRFLVLGGTRHIYAFEGTDPIGVVDEDSGAYILAPDWADFGVFPNGSLSRSGMINVGNFLMWLTNNGVRSATLSKVTSQLIDANASEQLDKTLQELLRLLDEDEMQAVHYARRNWAFFKAGDELYVYNYAPSNQASRVFVGGNELTQTEPPAWHLFTGALAQQKCYFVRENGDLICGGTNGRVSIFDTGVYSDLGAPITTRYRSAWHPFEKKRQKSVLRKHGKYIQPVFEAPDGFKLSVSVIAPYARESTDEVEVSSGTNNAVIGQAVIGSWTIGGNTIANRKLPLRWHGEQAQFLFENTSTLGPFTFSGYTVFYAPFGNR